MFATFSSTLIIHAIFFVCSVFFSFVINGLLLKFVRTLGIRNEDEATIRWSSKAKPALGGLSFYIIFLLSITAFSVLFEKNTLFENRQFAGILLASTIGFLLGLFDDAYNTKPWLKLFAQISCAVTLIVSGTYIHLFSNIKQGIHLLFLGRDILLRTFQFRLQIFLEQQWIRT
jgi:UDP-GlcNAc:undecaprenyl-phosphate GlcNAc-1-phosphate transferase